MPLIEVMVRKAAPRDRDYKLADQAGLYLFVASTGGKIWRYKYRIAGREKVLVIGRYPGIGLSDAREAARAARAMIEQGDDPSAAKQARRAPVHIPPVETFEQVAREWHARQRPRWSEVHGDDVLQELAKDVFPAIGRMGLDEITAPIALAALRAVEDRGAIETAHRGRQRIEAVYAYAIAAGRAKYNPVAGMARALSPLVKIRRQPAVTTGAEAREVYALLSEQNVEPETRAAAMFLAHTAQRVSDVRFARWDEMVGLDGPEPTWLVPIERMKGTLARKAQGGAHRVPLSPQAVAVLETIRPVTGGGPLPFPSPRWSQRPLSDNALCFMFRRAGLGGRQVPHGWRATFSTVMNERQPDARAVIDLMLAHVPDNAVEAAYNRSQHQPRRRVLAGEWGSILEGVEA